MSILLVAVLSASNPMTPPPPPPVRQERPVGLAGRMIELKDDEAENDCSAFVPKPTKLPTADAKSTMCRNKSQAVRKTASGAKKRPNRRGNRNW